MNSNHPLNRLRHHVSGPIARGEAVAITEQRKIAIQTNADFTPKGKRAARTVQTSLGSQHRWYVAGRIFRAPAPIEMTAEWLKAGK
jgi:hypothetical protein